MEIYVLVLSLLMIDDSKTHTGIRGFYTETECEKFIPAYQNLIEMFDNPDNKIVQSALTCIAVEETKNE